MIQEKIDAIRRFQNESDNMVLNVVKAHEPEVIDFITEDQLFDKGIDASGNQITPLYTPFTVSIKKSKGQRTDHVTLKDTGDFHDSIYLEYGADQFEPKATDPKTTKIEKKYGKTLGLTDTNVNKTSDLIREEILQSFKNVVI